MSQLAGYTPKIDFSSGTQGIRLGDMQVGSGKDKQSVLTQGPPNCWHESSIMEILYLVDDGILNASEILKISGWWFQPIWKTFVKMGIFPK